MNDNRLEHNLQQAWYWWGVTHSPEALGLAVQALATTGVWLAVGFNPQSRVKQPLVLQDEDGVLTGLGFTSPERQTGLAAPMLRNADLVLYEVDEILRIAQKLHWGAVTIDMDSPQAAVVAMPWLRGVRHGGVLVTAADSLQCVLPVKAAEPEVEILGEQLPVELRISLMNVLGAVDELTQAWLIRSHPKRGGGVKLAIDFENEVPIEFRRQLAAKIGSEMQAQGIADYLNPWEGVQISENRWVTNLQYGGEPIFRNLRDLGVG